VIPYKKDSRGHLIFDGGKIQEVILSELIEAVNLEFSNTLLHEIVFSKGGSGADVGKLKVGPMKYGFQDFSNSIAAIIRPFETLSQVINEALRFPSFRIDKAIVFWGTQGELCVSMKKD